MYVIGPYGSSHAGCAVVELTSYYNDAVTMQVAE